MANRLLEDVKQAADVLFEYLNIRHKAYPHLGPQSVQLSRCQDACIRSLGFKTWERMKTHPQDDGNDTLLKMLMKSNLHVSLFFRDALADILGIKDDARKAIWNPDAVHSSIDTALDPNVIRLMSPDDFRIFNHAGKRANIDDAISDSLAKFEAYMRKTSEKTEAEKAFFEADHPVMTMWGLMGWLRPAVKFPETPIGESLKFLTQASSALSGCMMMSNPKTVSSEEICKLIVDTGYPVAVFDFSPDCRLYNIFAGRQSTKLHLHAANSSPAAMGMSAFFESEKSIERLLSSSRISLLFHEFIRGTNADDKIFEASNRLLKYVLIEASEYDPAFFWDNAIGYCDVDSLLSRLKSKPKSSLLIRDYLRHLEYSEYQDIDNSFATLSDETVAAHNKSAALVIRFLSGFATENAYRSVGDNQQIFSPNDVVEPKSIYYAGIPSSKPLESRYGGLLGGIRALLGINRRHEIDPRWVASARLASHALIESLISKMTFPCANNGCIYDAIDENGVYPYVIVNFHEALTTAVLSDRQHALVFGMLISQFKMASKLGARIIMFVDDKTAQFISEASSAASVHVEFKK